MGYAWCSRSRLTPMRMVSEYEHYPKYDLVKMRRRQLLARTKFLRQEPRLDAIVWKKVESPGRLGQWPVFRYGRHKNSGGHCPPTE